MWIEGRAGYPLGLQRLDQIIPPHAELFLINRGAHDVERFHGCPLGSDLEAHPRGADGLHQQFAVLLPQPDLLGEPLKLRLQDRCLKAGHAVIGREREMLKPAVPLAPPAVRE